MLGDDGRPLPALHEVLEVVAHHQLVLATGHLSPPEIVAVVEAAVSAHVDTIVVTHPELRADLRRHPLDGQVPPQ